jgi:propionyl-CoA carboxylase alpha chain
MIRRILVANRGEIARRILRTCRAMRIETVAVYSEPDATEPHAHEADSAVALPGATAAETYLDIDALIGATKSSGADAVHPGYGFLAENASFARRVLDEGITWIGPSPEAIETMGSKLASKRLVQSVGVPILDGVDLSGLEPTATAEAAVTIGFPVLVKASAGGGGKGMRIVRSPQDLVPAVEGARREAGAAFGDDTVFLERYLEAPRHIEVQVFGDAGGRVISLFERECSIQRRHQKIIEEAPSPVLDAELRLEMGEAAISVASAVGYTGAGTVEFLYQDGAFYFLEMNTRLQVEHPVTEMITGLDLVRLQIEVADGAGLDLVPSISGHAIEARLYAEDPANGFLPVTGTFHRFSFPDRKGLRIDSGVEAGSEVSVFYDPLLAKVIGHAPTRDEAAAAVATALRQASIHGSVTNRALLVRVLEHPEFLAGRFDTHFLDRHDPVTLSAPLADPELEHLAAVAAALSDQVAERERAKVLRSLPSGWRNNPARTQQRTYEGGHGTYVIEYEAARGYRVPGLGGLEVLECTADRAELRIDGIVVGFEVARYHDIRHVDSALAPVRLTALPRFPSTGPSDSPGSLHAPMPGKVIRVEVEPGRRVSSGQLLLVVEAMKMEHSLRAPHDGIVVEVDCAPGDQVEAGTLLVVISDETIAST